ncbi:hypothetical protein DDD63_09595 [Actinobaculum sp. 313]|nr:hypothetical protein DDD63_09595 [Actinobaculum sp. 313]
MARKGRAQDGRRSQEGRRAAAGKKGAAARDGKATRGTRDAGREAKRASRTAGGSPSTAKAGNARAEAGKPRRAGDAGSRRAGGAHRGEDSATSRRRHSQQKNQAGRKAQASRRGGMAQQGQGARRGSASARPRSRESTRTREVARMRANERRAAQQQRQIRNRLIILGVLCIVGLVGVAMAAKFVTGKLHERSTIVRVDPTTMYTPVACTADMVDAEITATGSTAGSPVTFTITLTNKSQDNPCYIDIGWSSMDVEIESGGQHLSSTAACQAGSESKQLLLNRDFSTSTTVTWDGSTSASGCSSGQGTATAGTYVANLTFAGDSAPSASKSFVLE